MLKQIRGYFLVIFVICNGICSANNLANSTEELSEIDPRIVGGSPVTNMQQTPYQVSVRLRQRETRFGYGHICGGSVITQRVVVTAAHCIASSGTGTSVVYRVAREFIVVMGTVNLYQRNGNTLQYNVLEVRPNPLFNYNTLVNDIALMFIDGFIPWTWPTVRAIPLNAVPMPTNTLCSVSGWGKTETGDIAPVLMFAQVPIVSTAQCSINYGAIPISMLCAGFFSLGGVDACQGDSGGPLSCNGMLTGVVSWGNGCGQVGYPGVYSNVSYLNGWVVQTNGTFNYSHYGGGAASYYASTPLSLALITLVGVVLNKISVSG